MIRKLLSFIVLARVAADDSCASKGPYTPLTANEIRTVNQTVCKPSSGYLDGCTDCCPLNWQCCNDGTCMPHDIFCRYPESCCTEGSYCGQSCTGGKGEACGPLWAPADYTCCQGNGGASAGQLCKKPDVCCGDHCCPKSHFCCPGPDGEYNCCQNGKLCCNGLCCEADQECCGDHCCLKGEQDVCHAHESCCPGDRLCSDKLCCPAGDNCDYNQCCDGTWCGGSDGICCPRGSYCNPYGACCPDGTNFCPGGSSTACVPEDSRCCGDGTACPAGYPQCHGDWCCPNDHPWYCGTDNRCYSDSCQCCPAGSCCNNGNSCDWDHCQHCDSRSWWHGGGCSWHAKSSVGSVAAVQASSGLVNPEDSARPKKGGALPWDAAAPRRAVRSRQATDEKMSAHSATQTGSAKGNVLSSGSGVPAYHPPPAPSTHLNTEYYACFRDGQLQKDACFAFACLQIMNKHCGPENYLDYLHQFYCIGLQNNRNLFKPDGQNFLDKLTSCMRQEFVAVFTNALPCCENLATWGAGVEQRCFLSSGFCSVFMDNRSAFQKLFTTDGTLNAFEIYLSECANHH